MYNTTITPFCQDDRGLRRECHVEKALQDAAELEAKRLESEGSNEAILKAANSSHCKLATCHTC